MGKQWKQWQTLFSWSKITESWTIKKAEHWRIDAFELWCWRRLLRVPWTTRRSNQSILKEINPKYSLERWIIKLKLQYSGHLMWRADPLEKTLMLGEIEGRRRRGWQRMRWLDGITDSMDMSLSELRELRRTGKPGMLVSGVPKSQTWLSDWAKEQPGKKLLMLLFNHQVVSDSFTMPWTVAHQTPLFMGLLRQEYWSGLPFSSPGDLPDPGIKPMSPLLAGGFFTTEPPGKPLARSRRTRNILWVNEKWSSPEPTPGSARSRVLRRVPLGSSMSPREAVTSLVLTYASIQFHFPWYVSDFLFFTIT